MSLAVDSGAAGAEEGVAEFGSACGIGLDGVGDEDRAAGGPGKGLDRDGCAVGAELAVGLC